MTGNAWLWRHLETTGALGPDRIGRAVKATACRHCHRPTLTGLDNDMCAGVAHTDPEPLSPLGEALALLTGRATYALRQTGGRHELQLRDPWQIAGKPAGTDRADILAEHSCNSPPLPGTESAFTKPPVAQSAHPPY